jgi:hypothetical protein
MAEGSAEVLQAQSDAVVNLQAAFIAAAVSIVVAALGWFTNARRDRKEREYQRRRTALLDAQDAALKLRQALQDYGQLLRRNPAARPPELVDAERAFDHARGLLEVTVSRVDSGAIRALVHLWQGTAEITSISAQDEVSLTEEQAAWRRLNLAVGKALTGTD